MEPLFLAVSVIQSFAISLGVGSSTLAIIFYLSGKYDGPDVTMHRQMVRTVYAVLRAAMVLILLSTIALDGILLSNVGTAYFSTYTFALWSFVAVLFINAILMTLHYMPLPVGAGLQAGTWYALGITVALPSFIIEGMQYIEFLIYYLGFIGSAIMGIAAFQTYQKRNW